MVIPSEVQQWYSENRERLLVLEKIVRTTLDNFAAPRRYLFAGRIKTVESLTEKLDLGRIRSLSALDDAYAATIVIPTYAHEPVVRDFLGTAFNQTNILARGSTRKLADHFRFDATRMYFTLSGAAASSDVGKLMFEVQIHSAFDYAWSTVTHDLVYKNETVDWRRLRVAAQMKALVEQLDAIGEHFDGFVDSISPSPSPEVSVRNMIINHIGNLFSTAKLPSELKPDAPSRLAETVVAYLESDGCRKTDLEGRVNSTLAALDDYIDKVAPRDIPRSLTLGQLMFGIMWRAKVLSEHVKHRILCTDALTLEFPELKSYRNVVDLTR